MKKILLFSMVIVLTFLILPKLGLAEEYITDPSELPKEDAYQAIVKIKTFHYDENYFVSPNGKGSGVVINSDGLILTNYHVAIVEDENGDPQTTSYQICIPTQITEKPECSYIAKLISYNKDIDMALLQIQNIPELSNKNNNFSYLNLNSSDNTEVNDEIIALGYPAIGGSTITITQGIISGKEEQHDINWIKTDAITSFGSSGGAAIDNQGNVIGITSAAYSDLIGSLGYIVNMNSIYSWINDNKNNTPIENNLLNKVVDFTIQENNLEESNIFTNQYPYYSVTKPEEWEYSYSQENELFIFSDNDKGGSVVIKYENYPYNVNDEDVITTLNRELVDSGVAGLTNIIKYEDININGRNGKKILISAMSETSNYYFFPIQNNILKISYDYGENDEEKDLVDGIINSLNTRDIEYTLNEYREYQNENPTYSIRVSDDWLFDLNNIISNPFSIHNKNFRNFIGAVNHEDINGEIQNLTNQEYLDFQTQTITSANQMGSILDLVFEVVDSNLHYYVNEEINDIVMLEVNMKKMSTNEILNNSRIYYIKLENQYLIISAQTIINDKNNITEINELFLNNVLQALSLTNEYKDIPSTPGPELNPDSNPTPQINPTSTSALPPTGEIDTQLTDNLKGKLLLAVEDRGRVFYVNPSDGKKYEVTFSNALHLFQRLALGISNADLNNIPLSTDNWTSAVGNRLKGKLLLQVEDRGRIWYVDMNGKKHEVTWDNLMNLFTSLALGITNDNLSKIANEDIINTNTDTDNDGLIDSDEAVYGTDINNPDSDGDGYLDGEEVEHGYNPLEGGGAEL